MRGQRDRSLATAHIAAIAMSTTPGQKYQSGAFLRVGSFSTNSLQNFSMTRNIIPQNDGGGNGF